MTCPKLYGSNQMNSVKINNKNNLSKKIRKQQTPKLEQLKRNGKKTKNISEFSWQEKKNSPQRE